jgi:hypothetical protein
MIAGLEVVGLYATAPSKYPVDTRAVVRIIRRQKAAIDVQLPLSHQG